MSKELEALNKIQHDFCQLKGQELVSCYETIFNALKRLEAIDNAEPTKALECLENFIDECQTEMYNYAELQNGYQYEKWQYKKEQLETIKQTLIQAERNRKDIELIEKVRNGKTIIFVGKGLAMMNADKYHEYLKMEEEPISKKINKCLKEQAWDIAIKKDVDFKRFRNMLSLVKEFRYIEYAKSSVIWKQYSEKLLTEEEFNLLKEVLGE